MGVAANGGSAIPDIWAMEVSGLQITGKLFHNVINGKFPGHLFNKYLLNTHCVADVRDTAESKSDKEAVLMVLTASQITID